jgi:cyanophycinase
MLRPKGFLVCIGGAEEKSGTEEEQQRNDIASVRYGILDNIVSLMRGKFPTVEVITAATSVPEDYYYEYEVAFKKAECGDVGHINIQNREMASDPQILHRLAKCEGVMFTGGDQFKLYSILGNTPVFEVLKQRYQEEHFIIAGTSAGAAAMSNTMIYGGSPVRAYFKGEIKMAPGFGFFNDVIIDTHFDKRGRFARLAQAIATQPTSVGIGLGENTGVIVEGGTRLKAIGSGSVIIIEGHNLVHNNIAQVEMGKPISVSNLDVHIMAGGDKYDAEKRVFIPAPVFEERLG